MIRGEISLDNNFNQTSRNNKNMGLTMTSSVFAIFGMILATFWELVHTEGKF